MAVARSPFYPLTTLRRASVGWLPAVAVDGVPDVSRWCLVTAIAALGMKTSFKDLLAVGWRPIGLMLAETVWIALLVLAVVEFVA